MIRGVIRATRPLVALVAALVLAGCGSAPGTSGPQGVDGLEIPTPSADPRDFVDTIDNPWLPLTPGSTWTYERGGDPARTMTVRVTEDTRTAQGVTTTVVEEIAGGRTGRRLYAQDEAGNVWLFGETRDGTTWEAGVDGAEAGIAMLATPRLGDGYRQELAEGVAEDIAEIVSRQAEVDVTFGTFDDVLRIEETTPLDPRAVTSSFYVEGVGLVLLHDQASGESLELVAHSEG